MYVTATNARYLVWTNVMIRSMLRYGGARPNNITVIAFGADAETRLTARELKREFPGCHTIRACVDAPDFDFLRDHVNDGDWALVTDYLRAWVGETLHDYIWLDSDIIVTRDLEPLCGFHRGVERLAMASDYSIYRRDGAPCVRGMTLLEIYNQMLSAHCGAPVKLFAGRDAFPRKLNCGVISVKRNFAGEWRRIFTGLAPWFRSERFTKLARRYTKHAGGDPAPIGQGVWNILLHLHDGTLLPHQFNYIVPGRPRGTVNHYCAGYKRHFFEHAMLLRLAS